MCGSPLPGTAAHRGRTGPIAFLDPHRCRKAAEPFAGSRAKPGQGNSLASICVVAGLKSVAASRNAAITSDRPRPATDGDPGPTDEIAAQPQVQVVLRCSVDKIRIGGISNEPTAFLNGHSNIEGAPTWA